MKEATNERIYLSLPITLDVTIKAQSSTNAILSPMDEIMLEQSNSNGERDVILLHRTQVSDVISALRAFLEDTR